MLIAGLRRNLRALPHILFALLRVMMTWVVLLALPPHDLPVGPALLGLIPLVAAVIALGVLPLRAHKLHATSRQAWTASIVVWASTELACAAMVGWGSRSGPWPELQLMILGAMLLTVLIRLVSRYTRGSDLKQAVVRVIGGVALGFVAVYVVLAQWHFLLDSRQSLLESLILLTVVNAALGAGVHGLNQALIPDPTTEDKR